jgi:MFS family permease
VPPQQDSPRLATPVGDLAARPGRRRSGAGTAGLAALFAVVVAQSVTAAVLPATTRQLGLADWQAGAVTSASAAVVVLTSPAWGRRADTRGSRPVLLAGVLGALLALLGFAAVLAAVETVPAGPAWVALLVLRGLLVGTAVAAVGPAAQAQLVADDPDGRVAWIARAGAVRGLGTMAGAGLAAGLAAVAAALPVLAAAVVVAGATGWLLVVRGRRPDVAVADPGPRRATRAGAGALRDAGVRAAVTASAGVFLAMALVQGSVGFLVQDRYGLTAGRATALTGALLLVAGLGSLIAQGLLVPRLGWPPRRLVRSGATVLVVAVAVYALPVPAPVLVAVALVFGAGVGAAAAGCTSAASAAVGPGAQGDVAGLVNAVNALTFVVGPALAAASYGWHPVVPAVLALAGGTVALLTRAGVPG